MSRYSFRDLSRQIRAAVGSPPAMKTVPNVPIVSTGTYHLAGNPYPGGETTFTEDDLADAVAAIGDPAVSIPRLKLGHDSDWGDAEPAFGKVDNLRLGDDGQTIYGDYVGVPSWLADILPAVYPSRSIEAFFNVTTETGNKYRMVISALALLGVQLPGVATLEDLAGLYSEEMPEEVSVEAGTLIKAAIGGREAKGTINIEDVRRAYYDELDAAQQWWWIRAIYLDPNELIVDDDDGGLYRVPFEVKGDKVEFAEATPVKVKYVNAGQGSNDQVREQETAEVVYAKRSDARPDIEAKESAMDPKEIRRKLGLPEDATDDEVDAALTKAQEAIKPPESESEEEPVESEESEEDEDDDESSEESEVEEPAPAEAGVKTIDAEQLKELQRKAALGEKAHANQQKEADDRLLDDAVKAGKFPPSRKDHYRKLLAADREGTKTLIESLEKNTVPVEARGTAPGEDINADAYDPNWLSPAERARAAGTSPAATITKEA